MKYSLGGHGMIKLGMNFFQTKYLFEYIRRGKTTTKYNQSGVHQCRERSEQIVSKSETFCKKAQRGKFSKPQLHAQGRVFTGPTRIYTTQRHKEDDSKSEIPCQYCFLPSKKFLSKIKDAWFTGQSLAIWKQMNILQKFVTIHDMCVIG